MAAVPVPGQLPELVAALQVVVPAPEARPAEQAPVEPWTFAVPKRIAPGVPLFCLRPCEVSLPAEVPLPEGALLQRGQPGPAALPQVRSCPWCPTLSPPWAPNIR